MSNKNAARWLFSHSKSMDGKSDSIYKNKKASIISVASGKGGVGKTSIALKLAQTLTSSKYKVLLIDCDYNLSNCMVKLGLPINDNFYLLLKGLKNFDDCIVSYHGIDILSGCNGDLNLFENNIRIDMPLINLIQHKKSDYDYIILDSPAGLGKDALALNAYSDFRFVVISPDKSSITDSYSLVKILNKKFGVNKFHLLMNKIGSEQQYKKIVKSFSETVEKFLSCRIYQMGKIDYLACPADKFDSYLLRKANCSMNEDFHKIVSRFADMKGSKTDPTFNILDRMSPVIDGPEHDVRA